MAVQPSFLDLTFVIATFFCQPRMIVFWGGLTGLLTSMIDVIPIHYCLPGYAAISLIAALQQRESEKLQTLSSRLFLSLILLATLACLRSGILVQDFGDSFQLMSLEQLAGVALTFLFALMICFALVSVRRRELWSE